MDWLNCFKSYRRKYRAHALEKMIYIITVYEPDPQKWESDFKRRKK